jgi:hypothetical protein
LLGAGEFRRHGLGMNPADTLAAVLQEHDLGRGARDCAGPLDGRRGAKGRLDRPRCKRQRPTVAPHTGEHRAGILGRLLCHLAVRQAGGQEQGLSAVPLLDSGKFESRAALARYLGVSCARVTQVLK